MPPEPPKTTLDIVDAWTDEHSQATWAGHPRHQGVGEAWERFVVTCQRALGELVERRPEPFKALWSHTDDVVIMGAFGGYERGSRSVPGLTGPRRALLPPVAARRTW